MNQEKLAVCDRCGKKFPIPSNDKLIIADLPSRLNIKELGGKNPKSYLLCPACTKYVKNFVGIFNKGKE